MKTNTLKIIFKILTSVFFLTWVIFKTNWAEVLFYLAKIKLWEMALFILVFVASVFIAAYKWKMLAEFKGFNRPFRDFFHLNLAGTLINYFVPSFIAGEAYKAYQIASPDKKYIEAASTVMMDRITGIVGAMLLALFFSILNYKIVLGNNFLIFLNIIIFLSLATDFIIVELKKIPRMRQLAFGILPQKAVDFLKQLYSFSNNGDIIKKSVLWGMILSIVGTAFLYYILFWSLGIKVGLINYLSVIFMIGIISSIPITIDNIGLKEWAFLTLFGFFSVNSEAVVAVAVISRFLQMAVGFAALPYYLKRKKT
jgi:uncharacterized protein (TIRG00374 family)